MLSGNEDDPTVKRFGRCLGQPPIKRFHQVGSLRFLSDRASLTG
jgi:hypothetical protein